MQEVLSDTKKACSLVFFLCPELNILTYVPQTFLSAHPSLFLFTYTGRRVLLAFSWILFSSVGGGGLLNGTILDKHFTGSFVLFLRHWCGFFTGSCEKERLKVQFTAHQAISMTDSLTVGLTHALRL